VCNASAAAQWWAKCISILALLYAPPATAQMPVTDREAFLELMSGVASYLATLQDGRGAIVAPFVYREHQYTTAYFAAGVACLVDSGHARLVEDYTGYHAPAHPGGLRLSQACG